MNPLVVTLLTVLLLGGVGCPACVHACFGPDTVLNGAVTTRRPGQQYDVWHTRLSIGEVRAGDQVLTRTDNASKYVWTDVLRNGRIDGPVKHVRITTMLAALTVTPEHGVVIALSGDGDEYGVVAASALSVGQGIVLEDRIARVHNVSYVIGSAKYDLVTSRGTVLAADPSFPSVLTTTTCSEELLGGVPADCAPSRKGLSAVLLDWRARHGQPLVCK